MTETAAPLQKIAEGREAEMFAWEDGHVLRLYRGGFSRAAPEQQARFLSIAAGCGIRVPAHYGLVEVDGRQGIVLEKLDGPDLLTEIGSKPWRLFADGAVWGRLHAEINSKQAPPDLETTRSPLQPADHELAASPGQVPRAGAGEARFAPGRRPAKPRRPSPGKHHA